MAKRQGEVIWRHPDLEPGRLVPTTQVQIALSGAPLASSVAIPEAALPGGRVRLGPDDLLELRPVTAAVAQDGRVVIAGRLVSGDREVVDDIAPSIPGMALMPVEAPQ